MSAGDDTRDRWRLIYNPDGDAADVVAYGAAVAEGRIAGKYQLSNIRVPDTIIIQRSRNRGMVIGADVDVNREKARESGIEIARTQRSGRNGARTVGTIELAELMTRASRRREAETVDPDAPAVLIYTSGTTGNPKGVMVTHRNFHFQCDTVVRSLVPFSPEDTVIAVLPLYHIFGLANALVASFFFGATVALVAQYSPQRLLAAIEQHKATIMPAVPTMYQHLVALAKARDARVPGSLKYCVSGGAPFPPPIMKRFMERFETKVIEGYGLTETTSSVCANGQGGVFKEASIGPPATGVEMRIADESGAALATGEIGEILIRSDTVTPGYWNNDEATREAFTDDGWFRTGDLGYVDDDGFFFITDRKKDIIISRGFNISPREVEDVILSHEAVADAALVAMPGRDEDVVTAFIVCAEGVQLSEEQIREHCALNLAPYKQPKAIRFVEALPKSATGKVLRTVLRGEAEDRRLVERPAEQEA